MAETLVLTTPILAKAGITTLKPAFIGLDRLTNTITVILYPWDGTKFILDGRTKEFKYDAATTPTGLSLLVALNKADLSVKSLEKRVIERVMADNPELAGTVNGTPD